MAYIISPATVHHWRELGQELTTGSKAETVEEEHSPACSQAHVTVFYSPGPTQPKNSASHSGLGPPHTLAIKKMSPDVLMGRSDEGVPHFPPLDYGNALILKLSQLPLYTHIPKSIWHRVGAVMKRLPFRLPLWLLGRIRYNILKWV